MVLKPRSIAISRSTLFGFNAAYAVLFFYLISGYLITYTLSRNYEPSKLGVAHFYTNRAVRIFSLYWPLVVVVLLLMPEARHQFFSVNLLDKFTALFLIGIDWRVSFGRPGGQYFLATIPSLQQAWSLGAELTFYLMAPLLMRSWKIATTLLLGSLAVRMAFVSTLPGGQHDVWTYTFFPSTLVFFLLGHFAMKSGQHWPALGTARVGLPLVGLSLIWMTLNHTGRFDSVWFWAAILLFSAGLPGLFNSTKSGRFLNRIGDLSYPLYLVHLLTIMLFGNYIASFTTRLVSGKALFGFVSSSIFLSAAIALSVAAHYLLEYPMARAMHATASKLLKPQRRDRLAFQSS